MARAFLPRAANIDDERRILADRVYRSERAVLVDMIRRLQVVATPQEFFDLHLELFRRFKTRQDHIDVLKAEQSRHQQRREDLVGEAERDVAAIRAAQEQANAAGHAIKVQQALLSLLRVIGDGLAWRALGYDRAAITVLGNGTRVGRLAADEGLDPEIAQIEEYWADGVFAIHNDLTNCLLHGDVTAVEPTRREVVEVKRGRTDPNSAQMVRLRDAIGLINNRRHSFADGSVRSIVDVPAAYKTRLRHVPGLLEGARQRGYAAKRLSRCQWCAVASNTLTSAEQVAEGQTLHERAMRELDWARKGAHTFTYNSAFRRMRDRRHSVATVAPLSIYPFDPEDVADLMLGYYDIHTMLNIDVLARQFAERGISVKMALGADASEAFLTAIRRVDDRELHVQVDPTLREQLLMELMRPEDAIAAVKAVLDAVESEEQPGRVDRIAAMADEAAVWTARPRR